MNIPISLITYVLSNKVVNQFRLFLYLKLSTSGNMLLNEKSIKRTCDQLNYKSDKTFHANLQWLLKNKWIALNSKSAQLRIKSNDKLTYKLKMHPRCSVQIELDQLNEFRPFLYAAAIAWAIKVKVWTSKRSPLDRNSKRNKVQNLPIEMPNNYLANMLKLDSTTISKYRTLAEKKGHLQIEDKSIDLSIPQQNYKQYIRHHPDDIHYLFVKNGTLHLRQSSIIKSNVKINAYKIRIPSHHQSS